MVLYITPLMVSNNKGNAEFITIALPRYVIEQIDNFIIKKNPEYTSRPHVVKVALSQFFKENNR